MLFNHEPYIGMKKICFIIISVLIFQNCFTQIKEIPVKLYNRTVDFTRDLSWDVDAIAIIKNESDYHFQIKNVIDSSTRKKLKGGDLAWAMEYNGKKYLNLGYSDDLNNWNFYLQFDIIGKYSAIIINDKIPIIIKNGGGNFGGGLSGALIKGSSKWGNNWKDKNNENKKILFIDTTNPSTQKIGSRNAYCSEANYLTRKQLKKLSKEKFPNIDFEDVTFEKAIEIIYALNE